MAEGATERARAQRALLASCARDVPQPRQAERIAQALGRIGDWDGLLAEAEQQGVGPLAQKHLDVPELALPQEVRRGLKGLTLRHRRSQELRLGVVRQVAQTLGALGIDALWLKGTALAYSVYSDPGLRPMRDIDLLVAPEAAERAHRALIEAGFPLHPHSAAAVPDNHHHLPALCCRRDGLDIEIELHRNVLVRAEPRRLFYADLAPRAIEVRAGDVVLRSMSREDTLWLVYRHAFCMPLRWEPFRLIWVADIVTLVERWLDQIDWERVRAQYPALLRVLPLFDGLTPWDARVIERLGLRVGDEPPGLGEPFGGAPQTPFALLAAELGTRGALSRTFFPSEWWMRVHYGSGRSRVRFWASRVRHAYEVVQALR
jgi:hypothetical protein